VPSVTVVHVTAQQDCLYLRVILVSVYIFYFHVFILRENIVILLYRNVIA